MVDIWHSPTGHQDPDSAWENEHLAYDGVINYAQNAWTNPGIGVLSKVLILTFPAAWVDKVRWYWNQASFPLTVITIRGWDVTLAAWVSIYSGAPTHAGSDCDEHNLDQTRKIDKVEISAVPATAYAVCCEFEYHETDEPPPPPPPKVERWYPIALYQLRTPGGFFITLTTNRPCHLWLYWTEKKPWTHHKATIERGLSIPWDAYWCFVSWHKIEQNEEDDTTTHTFTWNGWEICQTKYFRFHGTIQTYDSPSDTPIFEKHYPALVDQYMRPSEDILTEFEVTTGWPHYQQINEKELDQADYIGTRTILARNELYELSKPSNIQGVTKLHHQAHIRMTAGGVGRYWPTIKTHDTIYAGPPRDAVFSGWYGTLWENNPFTIAPWTSAEINDLQAGCRMVSNGSALRIVDMLYCFAETPGNPHPPP